MEHVVVCVCPKSGNKSKDLQMLGTEPSQGFKQKNGFEQKNGYKHWVKRDIY